MKIIIAPQSFKGSLTAKEATKIISDCARNIFQESDLIGIPIADGGDGTNETISDATNGKIMNSRVKGPDNSVVQASWGLFNSEKNEKTGIIEIARASGLAMIDPKNPDTVGTSLWNLGNHTLAICFVACLVFVIVASYG